MSKSLSASRKVMTNYLSELLTDKPLRQKSAPINTPSDTTSNITSNNYATNTKVSENKQLETLLENVSTDLNINDVSASLPKSTLKQAEVNSISEETIEEAQASLVTNKSKGPLAFEEAKSYRQGSFQALFFNVGGLTVAVPLIELGGIHNIDKTTSLMGKPNWFKGVMLHREEKINVVDTALWVMPEKCDEKMKSSLNYQYVIMLNNSGWGLTAENLVDTVVLKQDEVKWLDSPSKRPWLAGLVKDKMCALLDVASLVQMLNEGSGVNQDN